MLLKRWGAISRRSAQKHRVAPVLVMVMARVVFWNLAVVAVSVRRVTLWVTVRMIFLVTMIVHRVKNVLQVGHVPISLQAEIRKMIVPRGPV